MYYLIILLQKLKVKDLIFNNFSIRGLGEIKKNNYHHY